MTMIDQAYLLQRAADERAKAELASDIWVARVDKDMAAEYERRAVSSSAGLRVVDVVEKKPRRSAQALKRS